MALAGVGKGGFRAARRIALGRQNRPALVENPKKVAGAAVTRPAAKPQFEGERFPNHSAAPPSMPASFETRVTVFGRSPVTYLELPPPI
jgi:hypothetical protein